MAVHVLLFDLGGVLVEFTGLAGLQRLRGNASDDEAVRRRLASCAVLHQFELGTLEPTAFAEQFVDEWNLDVAPSAFLVEFRSWSRGLLPGARELLDSLRPSYRLAALSNSNAAHWDRNTAELGITGLFDVAYSSHELGLRKPDPAIYRRALEDLDVPAARVLFLDDLESNVAAARSEGMQAFRVEGVGEVADCLRKLGVLESS